MVEWLNAVVQAEASSEVSTRSQLSCLDAREGRSQCVCTRRNPFLSIGQSQRGVNPNLNNQIDPGGGRA